MECRKCGYVRTPADTNPEWQCPKCLVAYRKYEATLLRRLNPYIPNIVPERERKLNAIASVLIFIHGSIGLYRNDIFLPTRSGRAVHLHDGSALMFYLAILCAIMVMTSVILDHHDQRNNEHKYQAFARRMKVAGWTLLVASILYGIVRNQIT